MHKSFVVIGLALSVAIQVFAQNLAGDEALSKVLIEGEGWQKVASAPGPGEKNFSMTDGACSDAEGNFYFSDIPANTIYKITLDGQIHAVIKSLKASGLKFGPDGRLYICTQGPKRQVLAASFNGNTTDYAVLADNVQPNDLIVSKKGFVYFTETPKRQVTGIDVKSGKIFIAATNLNGPNGIALSPDGGTLAVSEYKGSNVWTYRVEADGTLSAGAPYMTLQTPAGKTESAGDGMTVDALGHYFVTSALGIQMFDWTGRLSGVIVRPQNKGTVSCEFAGPGRQYLYACSTDKIYRRKLQVKGASLFTSGR